MFTYYTTFLIMLETKLIKYFVQNKNPNIDVSKFNPLFHKWPSLNTKYN